MKIFEAEIEMQKLIGKDNWKVEKLCAIEIDNWKAEKLCAIRIDNWNRVSAVLIVRVTTSHNSRYKIFGHLAEFKYGFVLGKFVFNGKNSHL